MPPPALLDQIRELLVLAGTTFHGTPQADAIAAIDARLDEPLRVAIAGKVKAGKSTLLNALVGEELAPTDAGECTKVVTWYRNGHTYRVDLRRDDGSVRQVTFRHDGGALVIDLQGVPPSSIDRLEVTWPSRRLEDLTLIDTPGLGSLSTDVSARSSAFLSIDDGTDPSEADAVIYLMRHLHHTDLDFLESFHDGESAGPSPISAIAVLSRADEIGACRVDALATAERVAGRLRTEPRMRQLCQTVVPVAGLLAQASMTLTEQHYRSLDTIAQLPRDDADALLLTVDRFLEPGRGPLPDGEPGDLLSRLGLFGVRISVSLIRLGAAENAGALAEALRRRSGIAQLRELLLSIFTQRRDVLKARVALIALQSAVAGASGVDTDRLVSEIERVTAGAHELAEVELMQQVRSGLLPITVEEHASLDVLFANIGGTAAERLGVDGPEGRSMAMEAVEHWRRRSENPLASRDMTNAARAITRSYEGILASMA